MSLKIFVISAIRMYKKYISPFFPHSCRFTPSCSSYSIEAIEGYGIFKGVKLSSGRLLKCHPFHAGGYDPVPAKPERIN
ncbi:MAG: membrane protein insertion efficiency factor YidD [Nitrospirae bacterium]|nr:membrane protein insertion efficiency factor YidD [Nitrospirota bacterium]